MTACQRQSATVWLAGQKRLAPAGNGREQKGQLRRPEMVQEQRGDDQVPTPGFSRIECWPSVRCRPVHDVHRLHRDLPAVLGVRQPDRLADDRLPVERRQFDRSARWPQCSRQAQRQAAITRAQLEHPQWPGLIACSEQRTPTSPQHRTGTHGSMHPLQITTRAARTRIGRWQVIQGFGHHHPNHAHWKCLVTRVRPARHRDN